MDAKVIWQGKMAFVGSADTGFQVPLDAAEAVGGENGGSRPMELIAIGLAGCTAMDVISILQKKRQDITDFDVQVHAERADSHPKVFTKAVIEYHVSGHQIDEAAVVRSIELSTTRYCPAQAMFADVFPMELRYQIFEVKDGNQKTLVASGIYEP